MPTPSLEKAAAFADVSKKTGGIFTFATNDSTILHSENASAELAKFPFKGYECADCGTHQHGVAVAGLQPNCVVCGSENVVSKALAKVKVPRDSELMFMSCGGCGTDNVFHDEVASVGSPLHCSVCGHEMSADLDIEDTGPALDADDMDLVDMDGEDDESLVEESDTTKAPADDKPSGELPTDPVDTTTTTQDLPSDSPSGEVPADPVNPGTTLQDPVTETQMTAESEELEVDMSDEVGDDVALSFVYLGDNLSLMANNQIIASLSGADAGDNADQLQTEPFRKAVAHTLSTLGLKKTLAQYGFKPNKLKVNLSKTVAKKIEARVVEKTKELSSAREEVADDMGQALDIAAAGFAGNFWRNKTDPLKVALAAELKALGIQNGTKLVDKVFAGHSVASQRGILDLARELIKKPVEARNALADAIDLAKYQPMVVKASDEADEDEKDDDEADDGDVASIATPVAEVSSASKSLGGASHYRSPELQKILGNGTLFN